MRYLLLLLTVLPVFANAQQDTIFVHKTRDHGIEVDTLYYEQGLAEAPILVGTQKLPKGPVFINTDGARLAFDQLERGEGCDNDREYLLGEPPQIEAYWQDSTRLVFHTVFNENCCYDFLGDCHLQGDTLVLQAVGYGGHCACNCCHTLHWTFKVWFFEEGEYVVKPKYVKLDQHGAVFPIPTRKD